MSEIIQNCSVLLYCCLCCLYSNLLFSLLRPPLTIPPPRQPPGPCHEQILGSSSLFARPLGEGRNSYVTEQQIKHYAMERFDRPGFCFYVSCNDNV